MELLDGSGTRWVDLLPLWSPYSPRCTAIKIKALFAVNHALKKFKEIKKQKKIFNNYLSLKCGSLEVLLFYINLSTIIDSNKIISVSGFLRLTKKYNYRLSKLYGKDTYC